MKRLTLLLSLVALGVAVDARAQGYDAAGQLALFNRNKAEFNGWDHWYSVAAIDGTVGRYWTPHFKTEFEIGTAAEGNIHGDDRTPVTGSPFPFPRYRDHTVPLSPTPVRLAAVPAIDTVSYSVRPLVTGGFKFYVTPHAFVRTEVRTSLSNERPLALQWRGGIGFDF